MNLLFFNYVLICMRSFYLCYDMLNLEKFCFCGKVISDCCLAVLVYKSAVSCFGFCYFAAVAY